MKTYRVVEMFRTVQGEGFYAGTASIFVRFAGCNLWSGHDEDRVRDSKRNGAECPRWCDTDFRRGEPFLAEVLAEHVALLAHGVVEHVVLTGGEPLLHIDADLIRTIRKHHPHARIAIETNGTVRPRDGVVLACEASIVPTKAELIDWVCCSPKVSADRIVLDRVDELKVVVPDYNPEDYSDIDAEHRFVQPRASTSSVGRSVIDNENMARAAAFATIHPSWRVSVQTHKLLGVP